MSKPTNSPTKSNSQTPDTQPTARKRKFIFPDIDGGGPSVTIEAVSQEEATEIFMKGHAEKGVN